ncbi:hypothetical protein QTI53_01350 [Clostridium perfringens]|nr:hypothetical protein [Clostridium perfringens]
MKLKALLVFYQCDKCWHRSTLVVENRKEVSKENKIIRKNKNTKTLEEVKNVY